MSIKTIIECDVCGANKTSTDTWWKVWVDQDGEFHSIPFTAETNFVPGARDICGRTHAIEMYHRYLETGQLSPVNNNITQPPE